MRGKGCKIETKRGQVRITPAYAGKRHPIFNIKYYWQDHPRVCGEKYSFNCKASFNLGSPPRMRGKVPNSCHSALNYRITPAYAGKRNLHISKALTEQDHPRVCGEKPVIGIDTPSTPGSPPRMRGKVRERNKTLTEQRITPAYAGKRFK